MRRALQRRAREEDSPKLSRAHRVTTRTTPRMKGEVLRTISVFIVSHVRLHREGLAALLRGCPSIAVLGADNPQDTQDTQDTLRVTPTDVALIDAISPSNSHIVAALRQVCARVRILTVGIRETA